ncbi:MAG: LytTR family transcriptional regulator [Eubacterium sp.]|nr:LytTR family transcriptional regulator [Eubacterium sp.]
MKIKVSVSEEKYDSLKAYLEEHGFEISKEAEYEITEINGICEFLSVRNDKKERISLSTADIVFIEAFGKEIEIHTIQDTYYSTDRMYKLESQLDPKEFIRISKSVIISRGHVKKIRPTLSMKFVLTLSNGIQVDVTRSYYSEFKKFYNI